jgi:integrase
MKLTMRAMETLKCELGKRDQLFFDDEQTGLAVRVMASGSKSFLAQFRANGQKRRVPLGSCSAISLAEARKAVRSIMGDAAGGIDAADARRAAKAKAARDTLTLAALIEQWRDLHLSSRRPSYAAEAVRVLRIAFARHLTRPAAEVSRGDVVAVLNRYSRAGKVALAGATTRYGRACYQWGLKRGALQTNPFANVPTTRSVKRDRVLTDDEIRSVWTATAGQSAFNSIVRTLILTGQRREEVAGMAWDEIDTDLLTWTIAPNRAKNGVCHDVPLSETTQALLRSTLRRQGNGLVFPGQRGLFCGYSKAKRQLDKKSGVSDWTLHDLRRTMATGLQRLGFRLEVTEATLNHVAGSRAGIVGVYQRHDYATEKRAALNAWGEHVCAIIEGRDAAGKVTALRRSA